MKFFKKKDKKKDNDNQKRLTTNNIRIRINRLVGNLPSEILVLEAEIQKDKYNNSLIINNDAGFKEEFPSVVDNLVSDILYKLGSSGLTVEDQLVKVRKNIVSKEKILSKAKNGKLLVKHKDESKPDEEVNINVETERGNLRLLKVTEYILTNKRMNGSFEKIEQDGTRCFTYLISDGELLPYWNNTPTSNGEPISLTPDMSLRKKYFYDNEQERIDDLKDMMNNPINNILKVITIALIVIFAVAELGAGAYLIRKYSDVNDESLQPQLDALNLEIVKAKQECASQLANQVENNKIIIDWASFELKNKISIAEEKSNEEGNNQQI